MRIINTSNKFDKECNIRGLQFHQLAKMKKTLSNFNQQFIAPSKFNVMGKKVERILLYTYKLLDFSAVFDRFKSIFAFARSSEFLMN
jgi:hypothetical protein